MAQYYRLYQDTLKKNNAMDFDDLIYNTLVLFKGFPEILEQYQNRGLSIVIVTFFKNGLVQLTADNIDFVAVVLFAVSLFILRGEL